MSRGRGGGGTTPLASQSWLFLWWRGKSFMRCPSLLYPPFALKKCIQRTCEFPKNMTCKWPRGGVWGKTCNCSRSYAKVSSLNKWETVGKTKTKQHKPQWHTLPTAIFMTGNMLGFSLECIKKNWNSNWINKRINNSTAYHLIYANNKDIML